MPQQTEYTPPDTHQNLSAQSISNDDAEMMTVEMSRSNRHVTQSNDNMQLEYAPGRLLTEDGEF